MSVAVAFGLSSALMPSAFAKTIHCSDEISGQGRLVLDFDSAAFHTTLDSGVFDGEGHLQPVVHHELLDANQVCGVQLDPARECHVLERNQAGQYDYRLSCGKGVTFDLYLDESGAAHILCQIPGQADLHYDVSFCN